MKRLAFFALALALLPRPGRGQGMAIPAEMQMTLIFKILTYDRQFEAKAGSDLIIGIVYDPSDPASRAATDEVVSTLYKFSGKTVKKLPIKYFTIE